MAQKIKKAKGRSSTSQFCREALAEKLASLKIPLSQVEVDPPDRTGKGGPRKRVTRLRNSTYPIRPDAGAHLNEPSSKPPSDEQDAARRGGEKLDE